MNRLITIVAVLSLAHGVIAQAQTTSFMNYNTTIHQTAKIAAISHNATSQDTMGKNDNVARRQGEDGNTEHNEQTSLVIVAASGENGRIIR